MSTPDNDSPADPTSQVATPIEQDVLREQDGPAAREPVFNLAPVVVALIGACVAIHLVRATILDNNQDIGVILRYAFIPARYSGEYVVDLYSWISPLTYSLLHGGIAHLAINLIWLAAFGSPLAHRIGTWRFLAFWAATSLGAVGLHYVLFADDVTPLVGASGAISGMMGAAARFAFRIDRSGGRPAFDGPILSLGDVLRSRQAMTFLGIWMVVNLVAGIGFSSEEGSQIAWQAHIGGFLVGFFLLPLFDRRRSAPQDTHSFDA